MSETKTKTPTQLCKDEAQEARTRIEKNGVKYNTVKQIILQHYPEYDTADGGERIKRVWHNLVADVILTEVLKQIASNKLKLKKSK